MNVDAGKPVTQMKKRNRKYRLYEFKSCEGTIQCMSCKKNAKLHPTQDLTGNAWIHLRKCQKRKWNKKTYSRKNIMFVNEMSSSYPATASSDCPAIQAPQGQEEQHRNAKSEPSIKLPNNELPFLELTMETMALFKKDVMYADDNIDFVINLSAIKTLNQKQRDSIKISRVYWYKMLCANGTDLEMDPNVLSKKLLIIPIHDGPSDGGHFLLSVIVNPLGAFTRSEEDQEECKILVFDSLNCTHLRLPNIKNVLTNWLRFIGEHANIEGQFNEKQIKMIEVTEVPKQTAGSNDCGPFVCHFAEKVMQSFDKFEHIGPTFDWRTIGNHVAGSNIRRKNVDDVLENASATFREAIAEKLDFWTSNEEYRTANDEEFEEFDMDLTFDNDGYIPSYSSLSKESFPSQSDSMSSKEAAGKFKEHSSHTFAKSSRDQTLSETGNPESITANDEEFEVFELDPAFDNNRWFGSLSPSPLPSSPSDESSPSQSDFMPPKEAAGKLREHSSHTSVQSSRDQVHRESGNPDRENSRKRKLTDHDEKNSSEKLARHTETSELPSSKNGISKDDKRTIDAQPKKVSSSNTRLRLENVKEDQCSVNAIANMLYSCEDVRDMFSVCKKYKFDMPLSRAVQSIFQKETYTTRAWRCKIKDTTKHKGKKDICEMVGLLLTPLNKEQELSPITFYMTLEIRCTKCGPTSGGTIECFNNVSIENDTTFAALLASENQEKPASNCKCGGQILRKKVIYCPGRYHIMVINQRLDPINETVGRINFNSNDVVEMFEDYDSKKPLHWKLRSFAEYVDNKNYSWLRFEDGWTCLSDWDVLETRRQKVDLSQKCVKILVFEQIEHEEEPESSC